MFTIHNLLFEFIRHTDHDISHHLAGCEMALDVGDWRHLSSLFETDGRCFVALS